MNIAQLSRLASLPVLALALTTGCASVDVRHETTPEFNGGAHKTFRLVTPKIGKSAAVSDAVTERLESALVDKGYQPAADPDVIVSWKVLVSGDLDEARNGRAVAQNANAVAAMGAGVDPTMMNAPSSSEPSAEKTLIVFIQDAETLDVLWVGWARASATQSTLEKKTLESVERVVEGLPDRIL